MAVEIERKFLVTSDAWREGPPGRRLVQGYLCTGPPVAVRVRIDGDEAVLNIKTATVSITRSEYEYPIPLEDAETLLADSAAGHVIEKTRYLRDVDTHRWEIDEFHGANEGLIVAEIELNSEDEAFIKPPWVGEEVSSDPRYLNTHLSQAPYSTWTQAGRR
jgi:adenylate cyclase